MTLTNDQKANIMHTNYWLYIATSQAYTQIHSLLIDLPITITHNPPQQSQQWHLVLDQDGLWFYPPTRSNLKPYAFSFLQKNLQRRAQQLGHKTPLIKALGKKDENNLTIIDATAGLGRDAFLLAYRGFQLTLIEQHPLLVAGLRYALMEWNEQQSASNHAWQCLWTDSCSWLKRNPQADIIYIDPMFPERRKSALVKKETQLLQQLNGTSHSEQTLLNCALTTNSDRVVVKRPRLGPYIEHHRRPNYQVVSKTHRFDVYLTQ